MPSASSRTTTDHDQIRTWAEERGGRPSCVRHTGGDGDIGILRIDFPGYSGEGSLEEISWDEWFDKFDERGLALLFQETTAGGQRSNFNKLVSRQTAKQSQSVHRGTGRARPSGSQRATSSSRSSSRSSKSTRSRNQNRSEGRSSRSKTTARASESRGRSSSRSAATRSSGARAKRSASRSGRASETGTRTSRASSTRRSSSGMRTSKSRSVQAGSRSKAKGKSSRSNLRRAA